MPLTQPTDTPSGAQALDAPSAAGTAGPRDDVLARLERVIADAAPAARGLSLLPDAALIEHIVEQHHAYVRRALPYVVALLAKAAGFHGRRNRKLSALCDAGRELADALEDQIEAEEQEIFPALLARAPRRDLARRELEQLDRHHREMRLLLARVRWLSDDFATPDWAGRSYQVLMEELAALEEDVVQHLHLESHVLVPRLSSRSQAACS